MLRSLACCVDLADLLVEAGQFCLLARLLPQVCTLWCQHQISRHAFVLKYGRCCVLRSLACCENLAGLLVEAGQFCLLARLLPQVMTA